MALTKTKIRFLVSLQKKKVRDEEKLFVVEGDKIVKEFLQSGQGIVTLVAKPEFISALPPGVVKTLNEIIPVSYEELKKVTSLKTPHNAMAVIRNPEVMLNQAAVLEELCGALDFIQDPGNLGTIIRAAAWFGIKNIICSENCVDVYNPKVIQATMGAIMNVNVHYTDLKVFLSYAGERGVTVYGTLLEGESVYSSQLERKGVILLGNESRGISQDLLPMITRRIMIPKFTNAETGVDSLNAGMAASIVFSEFVRRNTNALSHPHTVDSRRDDSASVP